MRGNIEGAKGIKNFGDIDADVKDAVLSSLAAAAVGKSATEMISRSTGQVMNPNLEVVLMVCKLDLLVLHLHSHQEI